MINRSMINRTKKSQTNLGGFVVLLIIVTTLLVGCGSIFDTYPQKRTSSGAERRGKYLFLADLTRYKKSMDWPVVARTINSPFGWRSGGSGFHEGLDLKGSVGDTIYAAHGGRVTYSGMMKGYGKVVVVQSGSIATLYAHNRRNLVGHAKAVRRGQRIAEVGRTGRASGPHLHFEVRAKTRQGRFVAVNPRYFLA